MAHRFLGGRAARSVAAESGDDGQGQVVVGAQEGFTGTVTLTITGLTTDVTAVLSAQQVTAGQSVTLTVTAAADTEPGLYPALLLDASGTLTHTTSLTVAVAAEIYYEHRRIVRR
ncbi:MAG: hypothetical protein R2932_20415 [Caldilineaceae bacterium]